MSVVKGSIAISLAFSLVSIFGCSSSSSSDSTPPVISNLSHTDNQKVTGSRTISFSVDATDETSLDSVTITHNGTSQTVTNSSANYSVSITLEDRTNNVIVVTANDADNSTSQTITLDYPFLAFTNGQAASVVIGQSSLTSLEGANRGIDFAGNTLDNPLGIDVIDGRLYIADGDNNRVLGFNSIPTSNNSEIYADFVIGQGALSGINNNLPGFSNNELEQPRTIAHGNGQLFVGNAYRINVWTNIPTTGNDSASHVMGETDFVEGVGFDCNTTFNATVSSISYVNGKILASDLFGHRVFIWNSVPANSGVAPDLVLGQTGLNACNSNSGTTASNQTLSAPNAIWSDGTRVIVVDRNNYRVLIWNSFPTQDAAPADIVLGRTVFDDVSSPSGPSDTEFSTFGVSAVYSNGNQIFVSDSSRVLIWDEWPTANGQAANRVLGHVDLFGSRLDMLDDAKMSTIRGISSYENKLIVSDTGNHRVLIFEAP